MPKLLASSRPRRLGASPPHEICDFAGTPGGAEACVASCARSVTHQRDALPHVLVGSLAPAVDAAKYAADFGAVIPAFRVEADPRAQEWIRAHATDKPRVVAFDVTRCCGGAKLCSVTVRNQSRSDDRRDFVTAVLGDGSRLLVDRRAARRLPSRFGLTVRGLGPFKRLDLALSGEQWGALLYD